MLKMIKQRRAWKKEIVEKVKHDKTNYKQEKQRIMSLPETERTIQLNSLKLEKKAIKQARKQEVSMLKGKEKRLAKREDKVYRKIQRRPIRFTSWGIALFVVIFAVSSVMPTVSHFVNALTAKDITAITTTPEGLKARAQGEAIAKKLSDEGIVLLKNEDSHLPLQDKKINVFGIAALDIRYGGSGSGAADYSRAVTLFDGLTEAGIAYNKNLHALYEQQALAADQSSGDDVGIIQMVKSLVSPTIIDEPNIEHLTDEAIAEAKAYSENALIVIAADGSEASDMSIEQLRLTENKRALIEKVSQNFENVTIVVNAGNALELSFVNEYEAIKSVVWIGTPGPYGALSLAQILAGELNPSGRLVDTYVYDNSSSPASVNFGDFQYDNLDKAFINYEEGIYVGYRFYETYYLDDETGYNNAVLYPFGYGLSYTDFEWEIVSESLTTEQIEFEVLVTNTGTVAGKDVLQLYFSAPYYEGGIEKSAIELATFAKTLMLAPGQSEVVKLRFDTREMASYDMADHEAYVLEQGQYDIMISQHVHKAVHERTLNVSEAIVYAADEATNMSYENHFENAHGELTYLSRSNFEGTFPTLTDDNTTVPSYVLDAFNAVQATTEKEMPLFDRNNGLLLEDMKGVALEDSLWDTYLDQFSYEELKKLVTNGAYKSVGIERLGVPQMLYMDGPAGFSYVFAKIEAASYPPVSLIAATWNHELAYEMGSAVGDEARAYGIQGWYAPGMNIHRTAQGGRNFEYFSEDPILTGKMAAAMAKGAQDKDVIVFMKHFALNDQETNARSGILVWANEQAIREIYLKPFEMAVKEGEVTGAMSSFSHIGPVWAGGNSALLHEVLRGEWGFEGVVSSDAVFGFMQAPEATANGNDLMLDIMSAPANEKRIDKAYKGNPAEVAHNLRDSAKHVFHTILKTYLYE